MRAALLSGLGADLRAHAALAVAVAAAAGHVQLALETVVQVEDQRLAGIAEHDVRTGVRRFVGQVFRHGRRAQADDLLAGRQAVLRNRRLGATGRDGDRDLVVLVLVLAPVRFHLIRGFLDLDGRGRRRHGAGWLLGDLDGPFASTVRHLDVRQVEAEEEPVADRQEDGESSGRKESPVGEQEARHRDHEKVLDCVHGASSLMAGAGESAHGFCWIV